MLDLQQQSSLFDYSSLDENTRDFVQQKAHAIHTRLKRTAEDIIAIGQDLIEVKARLGHGQFMPWVQSEIGLSQMTAVKFMRVATMLPKFKLSLNLPVSVLYELSSPSTPDTIIEQVEAGAIPPTIAAIREAKRIEEREVQDIPTSSTLPPTWGLVDEKPFTAPLPDGKPVEIPDSWKLPPSVRSSNTNELSRVIDTEEKEEVIIPPVCSIPLVEEVDASPELSTKGIQPGQVWQLGSHLLYCGDSASQSFIHLAEQAQASFAFADPPYNANVAAWDTSFVWQHDYLSSVAPIVAVTPGISAIQDFMKRTSMPYKWSMSYWIDNGMTRGALGFGNWIYVALFTEGSLYRNEQDFEQVTIDDYERVSITGGDHDTLKHKGRKPIRMMRHVVEMFTQPRDVVIDPFLGTGTALVACEQTGRVCVGAELNIEYCESIVRRWEKLTGREAELADTSLI